MASVRIDSSVSYELHKVGVRNALEPRREPYWASRIAEYQSLGLRKIAAGRATWIARRRDDGGVYRYKSLGLATKEFDYDQATVKAVDWFKLAESGVSQEVVTVADACREYVTDRRREKSEATAHDAEMRFRRTVYDNPLGARPLDKLRTAHLKAWREGTKLSPAASNRTRIALVAALNLAVAQRRAPLAIAQEWRDFKPIKNAGKRRDLFLDLKQRRALLAECKGAIRNLVEVAMLTGARAGELVNATRAQFDSRTKSMTFNGKTGTRNVPLSPAAIRVIGKLATDKAADDRLLTRDDGKPWAHSDWDELVKDAAKAANLPESTCLYTLRHSFVTTALTSGLSTLDVARLVGTSVMMIEKHYGHLVASAARLRLAKVKIL